MDGVNRNVIQNKCDARHPMAPALATVAANRPDWWEMAARLADDRDLCEMELCGAVLSQPETLTAVAEAEGVSGATFASSDLETIWLACHLARDRGTVGVLRLAMAALKTEPFAWDWQRPSLPAGGRSSLWNEDRLAFLATTFWPCEMIVRHLARRLLGLHRRAAAFEAHLREAEALLTGDGMGVAA